MKTAKLFTVIGHSIRGGKSKVRLSAGNAEFRGKRLSSTGNTGITLYNLPQPMFKEDAHAWLAAELPKGILPAFRA